MPRPPLVLGTWGRIKRVERAPKTWVAYARFRDYDGVTRQVERIGTTGAKAENALLEALRDRSKLPTEDLTPETRMQQLVDQWWEEIYLATPHPDGTTTAYRRAIDKHILPALRGRQLREMTVPAIDRFLAATVKGTGPSQAKTCKAVLGQILALGVRKGAMTANPIRDAMSIAVPKTPPRSVGLVGVIELRRKLRAWDAGSYSHNHQRITDLADVVDFILATGARTGETLAVRWIDLQLERDIPSVDITGTVIHVKKSSPNDPSLIRQAHPKTATSWRTLKLPPFAVDMLRRRADNAASELVFPSAVGTIRSPNNMRRQWRDFRDAEELPSWVTPKTFRKDVGTLVDSSVDLETASKQLGHSRLSVTVSSYIEQLHEGPDVRATLQQFAGELESA